MSNAISIQTIKAWYSAALLEHVSPKTKENGKTCLSGLFQFRLEVPLVPDTRGVVEAANKNIKKILRKMIQGSKQWYEKLPFALLGYRATTRTSVGATPYLLVYRPEAIIPVEVEIPSLRIIVEAEIEDGE
uniref:Uncharacterized protein LOC104227688 n=1 Tax=Nicotiana sylvestris TaxID=4096 RepID=A0A1U7WVM2_NICSY|nr:PREDICTED: uncharacterized protein LOC104227688 [Nicotiana sylvestris]